MSLHSQLGRIRRGVLCLFYRRTVPLGNCGPIVSFTFDDFPRSACSVGGAVLEKFGARGTYYVTAGLKNTSNELGELFLEEDLRSLAGKGHEIASQTYHHSSCRSVSLSTFRADVECGIRAMETVRGHNSVNFAYPYGHVTLRSKKHLGPFVLSSRSTIPGLNGPKVDLNLLRANRLYGDLEIAGQIKNLILQNAVERSWLVFYTHDIRLRPSEYGCTPRLFEFAVAEASQSGARVLTVGETLKELRVTGSQAGEGHLQHVENRAKTS